MTEIESRFIAFVNDHTYLKTTHAGSEDTQLLQAKVSLVE